jgi:hypothetical protein
VKGALVLAILCAMAACRGFVDRQAADSSYRILEQSRRAARRLPDLELARAALPGGILQLEAFALAYPEHRGLRVLHAEALCQYAVAFVFDDWEDAQLGGRSEEAARLGSRVEALADACAGANLALLPPAWREARARGRRAWQAMVAGATRAQLPQLLWIATVDAVRLALDPVRHLGDLGSIALALERCIALQPGFHDSDAELLLGSLEAGRSRLLGGADGAARFAQARAQLGEGALLVDVMFARGTAVARGDRALFEATLRQVVAADLARWPDRRLANELARRKAARYLAAIDRLFASAPAAPRGRLGPPAAVRRPGEQPHRLDREAARLAALLDGAALLAHLAGQIRQRDHAPRAVDQVRRPRERGEPDDQPRERGRAPAGQRGGDQRPGAVDRHPARRIGVVVLERDADREQRAHDIRDPAEPRRHGRHGATLARLRAPGARAWMRPCA